MPSSRDGEKCSFSLRKLTRFYSSDKVTQRFPFLFRHFTYHSKSFHQDIKTSFYINSSFSEENLISLNIWGCIPNNGDWERVLTYFSIKRIRILIFPSNTQWWQLNKGILWCLLIVQAGKVFLLRKSAFIILILDLNNDVLHHLWSAPQF